MSGWHLADLLIRGFGVRVPGGAPADLGFCIAEVLEDGLVCSAAEHIRPHERPVAPAPCRLPHSPDLSAPPQAVAERIQHPQVLARRAFRRALERSGAEANSDKPRGVDFTGRGQARGGARSGQALRRFVRVCSCAMPWRAASNAGRRSPTLRCISLRLVAREEPNRLRASPATSTADRPLLWLDERDAHLFHSRPPCSTYLPS